ncbi:MAG: hypothetical protein ACE5JI_20345 [Acidobacteriota bacterium]
MGTPFSDVRYGLRLLLQKPGTAAVAILALTVGIGASTAVLSVVKPIDGMKRLAS